MKKLLAALCLVFPATINATPYFRVIGQAGYTRQILSEACFRPNAGIGATSECTSIPIVTHSPNDGYLVLPQENWAPVTVGGEFLAPGDPILLIGPAANLAPLLKAGALWGVDQISSADSLANLKSFLEPPATSSGIDVTVNVGMKWAVAPMAYAALRRSNLVFSVGPALKF